MDHGAPPVLAGHDRLEEIDVGPADG